MESGCNTTSVLFKPLFTRLKEMQTFQMWTFQNTCIHISSANFHKGGQSQRMRKSEKTEKREKKEGARQKEAREEGRKEEGLGCK